MDQGGGGGMLQGAQLRLSNGPKSELEPVPAPEPGRKTEPKPQRGPEPEPEHEPEDEHEPTDFLKMRVRVRFAGNLWQQGIVSKYSAERGMHCVEYDDGESQWHKITLGPGSRGGGNRVGSLDSTLAFEEAGRHHAPMLSSTAAMDTGAADGRPVQARVSPQQFKMSKATSVLVSLAGGHSHRVQRGELVNIIGSKHVGEGGKAFLKISNASGRVGFVEARCIRSYMGMGPLIQAAKASHGGSGSMTKADVCDHLDKPRFRDSINSINIDAVVNCPTGEQRTPLAVAVMYNNGEFARILTQCGADPDVRMPDGETALTLAIQAIESESHFDGTEIVRMLLSRGATPLVPGHVLYQEMNITMKYWMDTAPEAADDSDDSDANEMMEGL
eukprot:g6743.t1